MTIAPIPINRCDVCPGAGKCGYEIAMANSGKLENAYGNGCRLPEATEANAAKARNRRARMRGENPETASAWSTPDDIPAREPTGDTCSRCGERLYWERGRGAALCRNRHWELAPGTLDRVNASRKTHTREVRDIRAEINARVEIDVMRSELQTACTNAITELDTGQIQDAARALNQTESWNEANAIRFRSVFQSLSTQIGKADTVGELRSLSEVFRSYHDAPECTLVRTLINQGYSDITQALNYRMQGTDNPVRYRYIPNPNRIVQVGNEVTASTSNRVVTGKIIQKALPPANGDPYEDEDEDDYDEDEDDYPRGRSYSSIINAPDSGLGMIAKSIMDARVMQKVRKEQNGECAYKAYHKIWNDDVATQAVYGLNATWNGRYGRTSEQINVCGSKKCLERAGQYFMAQGSDDYGSEFL